MKKVKLLQIALATLIIVIFNSYSKKSDDNLPENKCDYVKEWYIFDYWDKPAMNTIFMYDSQGRIYLYIREYGRC